MRAVCMRACTQKCCMFAHSYLAIYSDSCCAAVLTRVPDMLWQESPYDWLEDDGALTAAQLAHAHAAAAPWLDDGIYALLPYSAVLLTAVPAPAEPTVARAMPRSAAAPRCGDNGAVCNPYFAGLHQTSLGQATLCIAICRSLSRCICLCLLLPSPSLSAPCRAAQLLPG